MFRQNEQQVFNNFGIQVSLAICRELRYTIGESGVQRVENCACTPGLLPLQDVEAGFLSL